MQYIKENDRYEIHRVTGPDEWHEPVDNNVYTNYLARWNLRYVTALTEMLSREYPQEYTALVEKLGLTEEEIAELGCSCSKSIPSKKKKAHSCSSSLKDISISKKL